MDRYITNSFDTLIQDALSMPFSGWDFSMIADRWRTNPPSWDYLSMARNRMQGIGAMLDQDTGGGELLSTLAPFPLHTWASENYLPNIPVAKRRLEPLGVKIITDYTISSIPLPDTSLDLILNRHGGYNEPTLFRLLKPGGIFLTQQVGGQNNLRLNELLQDKADFMYSYWTKDFIIRQLKDACFKILTVKEEFPLSEFTDIGAVVFCLRIISWQINDFNVDKYRDRLYKIHQEIITKGPLQVHEHRILVEARKPL
jgi:SAM-dependent methyltransferase